MNNTLATATTFDENLAQSYLPHRVVKQAVLVPVPDGVETIINAEWDEEQKFCGPWYGVYNANGEITYGSARQEWDETHEKTDDGENTYVKITPILAYQHCGDSMRITTRLTDGTIETENTVNDGDWRVKWPHGEEGVMKDAKFRERYQVN